MESRDQKSECHLIDVGLAGVLDAAKLSRAASIHLDVSLRNKDYTVSLSFKLVVFVHDTLASIAYSDFLLMTEP